MAREQALWRPQSTAPHRPAAYLLARWGSGTARARGLAALDQLTHADEPYYYSLEASRLLHRLGAPSTAARLRAVAARVPADYELRDQVLLRLAIALQQHGEPDYVQLLALPLASPNAHVVVDVIRFAGASGD
jgi:hypothetical protein